MAPHGGSHSGPLHHLPRAHALAGKVGAQGAPRALRGGFRAGRFRGVPDRTPRDALHAHRPATALGDQPQGNVGIFHGLLPRPGPVAHTGPVLGAGPAGAGAGTQGTALGRPVEAALAVAAAQCGRCRAARGRHHRHRRATPPAVEFLYRRFLHAHREGQVGNVLFAGMAFGLVVAHAARGRRRTGGVAAEHAPRERGQLLGPLPQHRARHRRELQQIPFATLRLPSQDHAPSAQDAARGQPGGLSLRGVVLEHDEQRLQERPLHPQPRPEGLVGRRRALPCSARQATAWPS